ncbi:ZDBF2 protein, partial [Thalassarche chlororhynchos]|nr:ZDBF2 protein [Thalassarche chlororhynchos]
MFDRIKPSDEASASSAQGEKFKVDLFHLLVILPASFSLHTRGQEHPGPGVSTVQNRRGYCNCCHVHYSNLEQHVFSSQHRHFTTYCRNRMGTSSLMERFLQDVLQHHPHRYHDNRPTYDDMPLPITPEAARIACLSPEEVQKKRNKDSQEISSKDQESIREICSSAPYLSHEGTKKTSLTQAFIQKLERGQEHVVRISQQSTGICSNEKWDTLKDAQIANHSHEGQFTAVSPVPQRFSVSPSIRSSSVN